MIFKQVMIPLKKKKTLQLHFLRWIIKHIFENVIIINLSIWLLHCKSMVDFIGIIRFQ
jgi:hypothetical protein